MKRILITGVGGFVGSRLANALAGQNRVFGVGRTKSALTSIIWDFRETLKKEAFPEQLDVMIHAGAKTHPNHGTPEEFEMVNRHSCVQLAELAACIGVSHFVYVSTGAVYRFKEGLLSESDPLEPNGSYAASKLQGEVELQGRLGNAHLTILRLFFPYGFGQKGRLVPNLAEKIRLGIPIPLNDAQGSPRINPVFIDDVTAIVKEVVERKVSGIINVAGPNIVSIRDLSEMIAGCLRLPVTYHPGNARPFNLAGETKKLRTLLPNLRMTDLNEGLQSVFKDSECRRVP